MSPEENKRIGNYLFSVGKYNEASQQYRACINSDPKNSVYYSNNAICCYKLGLYNEAFENAIGGFKIDRNNVKALAICVKSKIALCLSGSFKEWQEALGFCSQFEMYKGVKGREGDYQYGKRMLSKVNNLEFTVKLIERKKKVLDYYKNNTQSVFPAVQRFFNTLLPAVNSIICPLTLEVFDHPVNISSGNTYEWKMVNSLIESQNLIDPLTRQKFSQTKVIENLSVTKAVHYFIQQSPNPLDYFS